MLTFLFLMTGSVEDMNLFQITTDSHHQRFPAIYENIIVWQDDRNQNWDIYGLNRTTREGFQITTDPEDQVFPVIYENIVFWMNERHDINTLQGYNLVTKEYICLPHHPEPHGRPALSKTMIVWEGSGGGHFPGLCRLILIDEKKVINMSILDEDGKKDIIAILRNPPCAGIVFSYK
jgi:beta propeller repeat protein